MVDVAGTTQRLHQRILCWDYWSLVERQDAGTGVFDTLQPVPDTFASLKEYFAVFEPLLLEECSAQLMRGVEDGEVNTPHPTAVAACETRGDFMYVRLTVDIETSDQFHDNDLVLLCKDNPENDDARQELHALGFIEAHEGTQSLRTKFFLTDDSQAGNLFGLQRARVMRTGLATPKSTWWLLKLANMSTITREWVALQHMSLVPFASTLLSGRPETARHASKHMDIPAGMKAVMDAQCNPSQMLALQAGLDGTAVVLIQGPPGTGKTRTIINLLSVVMNSARKGSLESLAAPVPLRAIEEDKDVDGLADDGVVDAAALREGERWRQWAEQCPWLLGKPIGRDLVAPDSAGNPADCFGLLREPLPVRIGRNSGPKAHVLVCAPSNSALDEIVIRILRAGLLDSNGNTCTPSIVRIGVNAHHSVQPVAIDKIVDARLGQDQEGKGLSRIERDRMRVAIMDEAAVVCSTLSFAGSPAFLRLSRKFDVVVIDEAAQAVEPSVLVPMVTGCKQVYLVGDPRQLPATVISKRCVNLGYDKSMFSRLQRTGYPVHVLDTQYRMHPNISRFPSAEFYDGKLLDGEGVEKGAESPWHTHKMFGPFAFFDISGEESIPTGGASIVNKSEVHMILVLYSALIQRFPSLKVCPSIAVISPYKAQVKLLRDTFKSSFGEEQAKMVDINTIDGFQGREKDITFFSCCRSTRNGERLKSIGFVADERRMNVALTRARCSLIVVGNAKVLQVSGHWASLVHSAFTRGCMYRPKTPYKGWMDTALSTGGKPVEATARELAALEKVRDKLRAQTLAAEAKLAASVAVVSAGSYGDMVDVTAEAVAADGAGEKEEAAVVEEEEAGAQDQGDEGDIEAVLQARRVAKAAAAANPDSAPAGRYNNKRRAPPAAPAPPKDAAAEAAAKKPRST